MRPHRLRLTAFGPFAGVAEVDLDTLSSAGPFLLHGDTGAGKTTLLDALGYALFGRVPGARAGSPLRSQHAAADVRTSVELWASVGNRTVHVVRRPEWVRPKKRGEGTTTENASVLVRIGASLEALRRDEATVLTRADEANGELRALVGMTPEQFFQVVLLPQGEFAAFLRAPDAERGALLQQVFGTQRYRDVEGWLAARRQETARDLGAAAQRAGTAAALVADTACPAAAEVPGADLRDWAEGLSADARSVSVAAQQAAKVELARRDAFADDLRVVTAHADAQSRRRAALVRLGELDRESETVERLETALRLARRAAPLAPLLDQADELHGRLRRLDADLAAALLAAGHDVDAPPGTTELQQRLGASQRRCGRLSGVRAEQDRASLARREHERELGRAEQAAEEHTGTVAALLVLPAELAEARQRLAEADRARDDLVPRTATLTALEELVVRAEDLVGAFTTLVSVERADLRARELARAADANLDALRRRRLGGMAAELAQGLVAGRPCDVCGATEHPAPAGDLLDRVDPADEDAAQEAAALVERDARSSRDELLTARVRTEGLRDEVDVGARAALAPQPVPRPADRDTATALLARLRRAAVVSAAARARTQQVADRHGALTARLEQVRRRGEELEASRSKSADRRSEASRRAEEHLAAARAAELVVTRSLEGAADLDEAVRRAEERVAVDGRAATLAAERERTAAEAGEASSRADTAVAAAGLPGWDEVRAARRDEQWCQTTQAQVHDHRAEARAVRLRLDDPALAVDLEPPADPGPVLEQLEQAEEALRVAVGRAATAAGTAARLERQVAELVDAEEAVEPLRRAADRARALADLVAGAGANRMAMSLSSYVLAARLEQVCEAANCRLAGMTDGRYELVQSDDRARGARRAGLGLAVRDAWTGQDRSAVTLSGGETFLASLALALGLSDVVTAEAGGTRIDAIFVDEGFGSLDADSLERALDTLDGLQSDGRMVGLVSHVDGMRQRIPSRLHVVKGSGGSRLVPSVATST